MFIFGNESMTSEEQRPLSLPPSLLNTQHKRARSGSKVHGLSCKIRKYSFLLEHFSQLNIKFLYKNVKPH